jgi:tRNA-dihydrouridine synthase A
MLLNQVVSLQSSHHSESRICVAPMMEWTDRHCRYLHRLYAPHALLYTEMIVAAAIVRGNAARLLEHDAREHPVALQLGGCDPAELAAAARIGAAAGYAEINLNVGCPSDRVKNGSFGACLMLRPALVAQCVRSLREATELPVTVKCRVGIDEHDDYEFFAEFAHCVVDAGVSALIVHARNAILGGLSPKENREIPPLKYPFVHRLKQELGAFPIVINGGICSVQDARPHLDAGLGVMIGRAAYHRPALLAELEREWVDPTWGIPEPWQIVDQMIAYAQGADAKQGAPDHGGAQRNVRLHSITRHMHGVMAGRDGARAWRRFLSEVAARPDARPEILNSALPIIKSGLAA